MIESKTVPLQRAALNGEKVDQKRPRLPYLGGIATPRHVGSPQNSCGIAFEGDRAKAPVEGPMIVLGDRYGEPPFEFCQREGSRAVRIVDAACCRVGEGGAWQLVDQVHQGAQDPLDGAAIVGLSHWPMLEGNVMLSTAPLERFAVKFGGVVHMETRRFAPDRPWPSEVPLGQPCLLVEDGMGQTEAH